MEHTSRTYHTVVCVCVCVCVCIVLTFHGSNIAVVPYSAPITDATSLVPTPQDLGKFLQYTNYISCFYIRLYLC